VALEAIELPLQLRRVNDGALSVFTANGVLVGQIKRIGGTWKFKALWRDDVGDWVPGGGPFTDRHNTILDSTDAASWQQVLLNANGSK